MTYEKNSNKLNQDFKQGKIFLVLIILILLILLILYKQQSILILFKAVYEDRQNQQAQELASETLETEENIDLTDNTLILYNENALDSKEIAEYYATKRGISFSQICPIKVPTGMYAEKKHLYGARRKVISSMLSMLHRAGFLSIGIRAHIQFSITFLLAPYKCFFSAYIPVGTFIGHICEKLIPLFVA